MLLESSKGGNASAFTSDSRRSARKPAPQQEAAASRCSCHAQSSCPKE